MKIEVPLGEIVDRVTILTIKEQRLPDLAARGNATLRLQEIVADWGMAEHPPMDQLPEWDELLEVNQELWRVEDELRNHERREVFDEDFVELARSVYHLNDRRAALKRSIDDRLGSRLVEEKSYSDYGK